MRFCNKCLEGGCHSHKWFTDLKFSNEKAVLIAELKHIIDWGMIPRIIQKVYLAEHQYSDSVLDYNFSYVSGTLTFVIKTPTVAKKDSIYFPVMCYSGKDDVVDYQIEVEVKLMRHNPMILTVKKSIFDDTVLHSVELINFCDSLHMESMNDYPEIVSLATSRLNGLINSLSET